MKNIRSRILRAIPYLACFGALLALMFFGSQKDDNGTNSKPIISAINDTNFVVTADQLSESYIVADVANVINLPSVLSINENYASIVMKYEVAGASGGNSVITKPNIIDTSNLTRGIVEYVVQAGDTLASIAAKSNGVTETQIRWSNNMKTSTVTAGQTIYIPPVQGILYTVKSGDTIEALATKYGSKTEEIVIYNDLEVSSLTVGATIILPDGALPEKERPEYVAPTPKPPTVYYSYVRDSGVRQGMTEIQNYGYWSNMYYSTRWQNNPGAFGNCTWFVWYWRRNNMGSNYWLPGGTIGNAGTWTYAAWSNAFLKNKTPAYGAVVQTSTGSPGHVAVVVGVVSGSHILIQEMNYGGYNGKFNHVYQSKINWADALKYNYIHGKR
ncbi:MAG: LysM peptidoglycan-binding domain-containing protein [Candidatus Nomurabacteria bacterium]|jgi:surface antigen/LysM repeat protein|nr:LysM peptidoglycan-binding domain-containing protein [Candidatus Nomurabacteria bacterium]